MKIIYNGTGTARIERVGEIASGNTIEVPDKIAKALLKESPSLWSEDRPSPKKARGGS